jgi:hypothetical protein
MTKEFNSDRWLYATMKPGRDPMDALANTFSRLKSPELGNYLRQHVDQVTVLQECAEAALTERKDQRLVLFIDQFEEVFTQINKDEERLTFLNLLTYAATAENGRVIILFSMRSDFVPNCATYPQLNSLLNQQFIQIGSMQPDELVSAIAQPALRVGLRIEPDLVSQIINDMKGEPGALPLMQFALKDLFDGEQAQGGMIALTLNEYFQRGGIQKSLERHADSAFAGLNEHEQELARAIFSALIEIGRGTLNTRRTALSNELIPAGTQSRDVLTVMQKLANARLITTDRVTVTISHEKLIDAWPWLKKMVNENRDVIALQNEIAEDAKEWEEHARDESYLYTGARLANAGEKLEVKKLVLSALAQSFVDAGIQMEESKRQEEEKHRQKELDNARKLAATERRGRLVGRGLLVIAAILIIVLSKDPIRRESLRQKAMTSEIVSIEAGKYLLGDKQRTEEDPEDYLPYQEYPVSAFSIDVNPVTNERYGYCIQAGICARPNALRAEYDYENNASKPVVKITALDAYEYCNWLGMHLPSDKEWEAAARMNLIKLPANQPDLGSFYEWTRSIYNRNEIEWTDISQDPSDWLAKKGGRLDKALNELMTYRQGTPPTDSDDVTGFRCASNP